MWPDRAGAGGRAAQPDRARARATYNPALTRPGGLWHHARATLLKLATQSRAPEAPAALRVRAGLTLGTLCYGSLDALCQPGAMPPLPDLRLPLAVVGPAAAHSANWCVALDTYWCPIAAGPFWYGDDRQRKSLQNVTIPYDYKIARYPLTNADFARFVASGGYAERRWWTEQGWEWRERADWTAPHYFSDVALNNPLQPVAGVSWYEAAYCLWLTEQGHRQGWLPEDEAIRLPTSLEWERAARHTDKRRYPWGDDAPNVERANYNETGIGRPSPVGCFPSGMTSCGALDMAGNVMEWMATDYQKPLALEAKKDFTDRDGVLLSYGSYWGEEEHLCCGARFQFYPGTGGDNWGIRIVRT